MKCTGCGTSENVTKSRFLNEDYTPTERDPEYDWDGDHTLCKECRSFQLLDLVGRCEAAAGWDPSP